MQPITRFFQRGPQCVSKRSIEFAIAKCARPEAGGGYTICFLLRVAVVVSCAGSPALAGCDNPSSRRRQLLQNALRSTATRGAELGGTDNPCHVNSKLHSFVDSITRKGNVVARSATAISTLEKHPSLKQTPAAAARLEATRNNTGT